jgi:hypothetical protein
MYFFGDDEKAIYALLALDMLKDARNRFNQSINAARVFLRSKGFSEKEIKEIIEMLNSL